MRGRQALLGAVIGILLVLALVWAWQTRESKNVSHMPVQVELDESFRDLKMEIAKRFAQAADILNSDAPKQLQPGIVLKGVEVGEGPSMTYRYVVEKGVVRLEAEPVTERTCGIPEMRDYMQYGVFYKYVYEDGQGKELLSLTVDEAACKAHERQQAGKSVNREELNREDHGGQGSGQ